MKRVRPLSEAPEGLDEYLAELGRPVQKGDYVSFKKNCPNGYKNIQTALIKRQHGLCAYCEYRIGPEGNDKFPIQIEHYETRDDCPDRELDYTNMLGCCNGGSDRHLLERYQISTDSTWKERWQGYTTDPIKENLRCGQAKDDCGRKDANAQVLDPRHFPLTSSEALPNLVQISRTKGEIVANAMGCAEVRISEDLINQTLHVLNLNAGLRHRRRQVWEILARKFPPEEVTIDVVKESLLPDPDGILLMFWSTVRCYFGGLSEEVLDQEEAKEKLC